MAKIQDIDIPYLEFAEAAAPGTPASGIVRIYAKTDGSLYQKDDAGTETGLATGATFSGCKAYYNTTQTLNSGATRVVEYNAEDFDTDVYHDTATNPSRFTVPATGYYLVIANVFLATAVGADWAFRVNGSAMRTNVRVANANGESWVMSTVLSLTAADYVELVVTPDSNLTAGHASARQGMLGFEIIRLG